MFKTGESNRALCMISQLEKVMSPHFAKMVSLAMRMAHCQQIIRGTVQEFPLFTSLHRTNRGERREHILMNVWITKSRDSKAEFRRQAWHCGSPRTKIVVTCDIGLHDLIGFCDASYKQLTVRHLTINWHAPTHQSEKPQHNFKAPSQINPQHFPSPIHDHHHGTK